MLSLMFHGQLRATHGRVPRSVLYLDFVIYHANLCAQLFLYGAKDLTTI